MTKGRVEIQIFYRQKYCKSVKYKKGSKNACKIPPSFLNKVFLDD